MIKHPVAWLIAIALIAFGGGIVVATADAHYGPGKHAELESPQAQSLQESLFSESARPLARATHFVAYSTLKAEIRWGHWNGRCGGGPDWVCSDGSLREGYWYSQYLAGSHSRIVKSGYLEWNLKWPVIGPNWRTCKVDDRYYHFEKVQTYSKVCTNHY